jgi:proline iminopeptidase
VAGEFELKASDGVRLRAVVEGDGPPVALLHGGPGLWDYTGGLAAGLRDDFTVHRWDQRGCGRYEPTLAYGLDVAVRDVQEARAGFQLGDPWAVVGHSWGAYLALLTALEHPESTAALVYISGTGAPSWWREHGRAGYRAALSARMRPGARRRLEELDATERSWDEEVEFRRLSWVTDFAGPGMPPGELEEMATTALPINWAVNRSLSDAELYPTEQLLAACQACQVPSLFIHGTEDPRPGEGARLLHSHLPNAQFLRLDGAGHLPWVEQPARTVEAIRGFLNSAL